MPHNNSLQQTRNARGLMSNSPIPGRSLVPAAQAQAARSRYAIPDMNSFLPSIRIPIKKQLVHLQWNETFGLA